MQAPKLDQRERAALALGGLALFLVLLLAIYIPAGPKGRYDDAQDRVADLKTELKLATLNEIEEKDRLASQQVLMERLAARPATFDFFAFVDQVVRENNLVDRYNLNDYKTRTSSPKQPMVDLRLEGVTLEELIGLLHSLYESTNLVTLYKMDQLRPAAKNEGLDCQLTLMTLRP